jgi:1,4-alpha-glucan branching enzyme
MQMERTILEQNGIKIDITNNPYIELFFDWEKLPGLDLSQHYYLAEISPDSNLIPNELIRPNSAGPMFCCLRENCRYTLRLLKTPHLQFDVQSSLKIKPDISLIAEHESLFRLIWGNIDFQALGYFQNQHTLEISFENKSIEINTFIDSPYVFIDGHPRHIKVCIKNGPLLFEVNTNLKDRETIERVHFDLNVKSRILSAATSIQPLPGWQVRAEILPYFNNYQDWLFAFIKKYPKADTSKLIGSYVLYEDGLETQAVRMFGFSSQIDWDIINHIQIQEKNYPDSQPVSQFKFQLQITSPHRELLKTILLEKTINAADCGGFIGFSEAEIIEAQNRLFEINPLVKWEQSYLELVFYFKGQETDWQEFQRDQAYGYRWDFIPDSSTHQCQIKWVLNDLTQPDCVLELKVSGIEHRMRWEPKVDLKPYHDKKLLAWWDLDKTEVAQVLKHEWDTDMSHVGFYLKVHEEYLGNRRHRSDLDVHIRKLFAPNQNIYFNVDDNKNYSVEIVARYKNQEHALTPVSSSIVSPRSKTNFNQADYNHRSMSDSWYHTTQHEVRHQNGDDSANKGKVLLHLHMHSPNLFRADPFRESFLRPGIWPIETVSGEEVHNTPGEWVLKNCLDSWLPLLRVFETLAADKIDFQVSLNISPPVAYTLSHPRFKDYMSRYLDRTMAHVKSQLQIMKSRLDAQEYIWAGERYLEDIKALAQFYNHDLGKDIIGTYRTLSNDGYLELSTCTATHGMAGLLQSTPDALNTQIQVAKQAHNRIFGDDPRGIWLAENSYFPGVEKVLEQHQLHYFFVEAEAILNGSVLPTEEEYNPVLIPASQICAFGRSRLGRMQVWDAKIGYAGHPDFREYHFRHFGLQLKRITTKLSNDKGPYNPDNAEKTARHLAQDFYIKLCDQIQKLERKHFQSIPLITCTYDAELFGHHWFEGPIFLEELLRECYRKSDYIGLTTPSHYLASFPSLPEMTPNPSTWGHESFHLRWTAPKVAWTFRELDRADQLLRQYLKKALHEEFNSKQNQAIQQMGAELIRSQSSDLTFVMISGDFEEDMQREILKYLDYFYMLKHMIDNNNVCDDFLFYRQHENDMFPEFRTFYGLPD